jgi:hypothetical protein
MPITVESRRKKPATVAKLWPGATVIDVTSRGKGPWVRFSPFYPHCGIPIPGRPGEFAASVEGLWQGLKVFEREGVDPSRWVITDMKGIKRSGRSRGAVLGHCFGADEGVLLGYRDARVRIYLPAYRWVLENRLAAGVAELRARFSGGTLVLLDYETNGDVDDLSTPLSHAALLKHHLEGTWPAAGS